MKIKTIKINNFRSIKDTCVINLGNICALIGPNNSGKSNEMRYMGAWRVALTNLNIYFASAAKNFKVPYKKILILDQYEDGLGFQKDGISSKHEVFKGLDGWFTYNLISNFNQM